MKRTAQTRNLVFITSSAEYGGAEKILIYTVKALEQINIVSSVLIPSEGPFARELTRYNIEYHLLTGINWYRRNPIHFLPYVYRIARFAKKKKARAIVANIFTSNQYCVMAAKIAGCMSICYPHTMMNREEFSYHMLGRADLLVADLDMLAEEYRSLGGAGQKVESIYVATDTDYYCPERFDRSFMNAKGISEDEFVIGMIAAITKDKGQHIMLQAMPKILKEKPHVRLLFVGGCRGSDPDYLSKMHKMAWDLGVSGRIIFTGQMDDLRQVYAGLDLMAFPSLREGSGTVTIEAMAMKVPVIASAVGGLPEVVRDGVTGLLIPPGDPGALADAVLRLINDTGFRKSLSEKGRKWVEERYSLSDYFRKSKELFNRVCGK